MSSIKDLEHITAAGLKGLKCTSVPISSMLYHLGKTALFVLLTNNESTRDRPDKDVPCTFHGASQCFQTFDNGTMRYIGIYYPRNPDGTQGTLCMGFTDIAAVGDTLFATPLQPFDGVYIKE